MNSADVCGVSWRAMMPYNVRASVEASTIGFRPGQWPDLVAVAWPDHRSVIYRRAEADWTPDQELAGYRYRSADGDVLMVFND